MIPRVNVAVNAAFFVLLAYIYVGDLRDAAGAATSEVSAMSSVPSVPFAALLLALSLVGGGLTVFGVMKKRDGTWRGYRVMPIIAVVGLFVDRLVVSADQSPFTSSMRAAAAIETFERRANEMSTTGAIPTDAASLEKVLDELGEPPWLAKGQPIAKWVLKVSTDCTGPQVEAKGEGAGTMIYCAAADRSQAWITAVGLPQRETFGPPQVVASSGQPLVGVVQRRAPEPPPQPEPGEAPEEPEPAPMYFDSDAGNLPPVP